MKIQSLINWKLFGLLLGAGVFGFLAVLPFVLTLQADLLDELPIPLSLALLLSLVQTTILLTVAIFVGLFLGKKVGLGAPLIEDWLAGISIKERLKSFTALSVALGTLAAILILVFDYLFSFFIEPFKAVEIALWQGFLGAFYGGIFEEILMRLFLVTLLVWIFSKIWHTAEGKPKAFGIWFAILIASIVFGLGHLPATALLTTLTPLVVARAILLNGIGGIIFGWLYWKKGLVSAMIAHFCADIVLHVLFPLLF